ncbi:ApbE-like lipoprotein [Nitrobacter sp. Nb-311A]|uniref:FAD:protein FMN transferase n=1 Tax=unclassified Nitrobacter TaxID=2620411 RepID=UPI00006860B5|nr:MULTISPECIES: FAD:protein FMN transferase [unclassified Nitrobacter]EAQ36816.1 ApbE-like lipoprotein [Nitrobacter sp. Nb-311A]MCB1394096.1 FAD:protein FMN transferase [Nitrobacter sp.]MCV0385494.1 FAD:protein FMN transferase [Nitrobacter sp.]
MTASITRRVAIPTIQEMPHAVPEGEHIRELSGTTMGTTWSVKFVGSSASVQTLRRMIPLALGRVIAQMSPWEGQSDISRFNRLALNQWQDLPPEFGRVMVSALRIAAESGGAYDPTMGALVDLWGFGPGGSRTSPPPQDEVARRRRECGWQQLGLDTGARRLRRSNRGSLDLCGIAKGFAVDLVAERLRELGIHNALVEIGGELRGHGVKPDGSPWWVEIDRPARSTTDVPTEPILVALHQLAIATSGCERGFTRGANHFSHTLDPRTGWPIANGMMTATVLHRSCMEADGYATALMVLGPDAGVDFAVKHQLAALLLFRHGDTVTERTTPALDAMLA